MNFSSVDKIADVITRMQDSDEPRELNRTRINSLFNGDPPFTEDEAREQHVQINYALGSAPDILTQARGQWENAMTSKDRYFSVRLRIGPGHKRFEWGNEITTSLARLTKSGEAGSAYTDAVNSEGAQFMLHGIGPSMWEDEWKWAPHSVALEDLKIPSRTLTSLTNLNHFAVMRRYTPNQLYRAAFGKYSDARWNKKIIRRILAALADDNNQQTDWDTYRFPERLEEDFKSNGGFWGSDSVPTVNCWDFFYQDDEDKGGKWQRRILLDYDQPTIAAETANREFLYTDPEPYADKLSHILHICFANGAHVAPFRYHSVRGLGYRLYGPEKVQQRIQIRFAESVLQEMMWIFSNVPAEDRERLESIFLHHMGVLPEGAKWVPAQERYRPDLDLILAGMNQNRQMMAESSSTYVQEAIGQNDRETATKTIARMNQANQLVSTFLNKAYDQQAHQYNEICRRFCLANSPDPDVKKFRAEMKRKGIPDEVLDVEEWDVIPERTVGNGNQQLAALMVNQLMQQFPRYDPEAQRQILHIFTDINSGDSALAESLVPMKQQDISPAMVRAGANFGTLMQGVPVPMGRGINNPEYIETLLKQMGVKVQSIERAGGMTTMETVVGLATVGQEIERHIQMLEQDETQEQRVKMYRDALGQMMNLVKAYYQRLAEQAQQQGQQLDPELQAKMQAIVLTAQTQAKIKEQVAAQKMRHNEIKFQQDERRKNLAAGINAQRTLHGAKVDAAATDLRTEADIRNEAIRTQAELKRAQSDSEQPTQ